MPIKQKQNISRIILTVEASFVLESGDVTKHQWNPYGSIDSVEKTNLLNVL